jgi:hypothetical protein
MHPSIKSIEVAIFLPSRGDNDFGGKEGYVIIYPELNLRDI